MKSRTILALLSQERCGDWNKIYQDIQDKNTPALTEDQLCTENYITIIDDNYPMSLKQVHKPPFVLYYKGDINLINEAFYQDTVSITGARTCKLPYTALTNIIEGMTLNNIVVSGGAIGTDTVAIRTALNRGLKVIVVLPCGINSIYPASNKDLFNAVIEGGGLLLSEYPSDTSPSTTSFLDRDRLIAALALKLLATEVHLKSGTLATINFALNAGREVYVIPTYPQEGLLNNSLIREGALVAEYTSDIFTEKEDE